MATGRSMPRDIAQRARAALTRLLPRRGGSSGPDSADAVEPSKLSPAAVAEEATSEPVAADTTVESEPGPAVEVTVPDVAATEVPAPPVAAPPAAVTAVAEPTAAATDVAEPAVAEPAVATPVVGEPAVGAPTVAEPEVAPPEVVAVAVAEPEVAPPEVVAVAVAEPEIAATEPTHEVAAETVAEPESTHIVPRRMADAQYRAEQFANRYEGNVAPINRLVDELVEESGDWMPYVAPVYGGTDARLLTLFRDPGPKTQADKGSGMLSLENDDQSAERFVAFFEEAGLRVDDLITWNTHPWYINRKPTSAEIDRGLDPLERLIALLPRLSVVLVHGGDAQTAWRRFERKHPALVADLLVIPTYHTSKQALFTPDPEVRAQREAKLRADFAHAAAHLAD